MADVFVSYARADRARVEPLVAAFEAQGLSVWWDTNIAAGQEFDKMIAHELAQAKCVVVVWTEASVTSRWVRGEARDAADRGILIPIRLDGVQLPIDARAIHTTDLDDWDGNPADPAFAVVLEGVRSFAAPAAPAAPQPKTRLANPSICVLPFENISGDPEQAYFSDGITEDIITDLSHISSLEVTSRNSAFVYKGKAINIPDVARQLGVRYILEGSVRKAGNRVRITAQLIEGATDKHLWAERYDRDLDDIFAVQDDISRSIVTALKVRIASSESRAIAQRGTSSPEAYRFFLMARRFWMQGWTRRAQVIIRLCEKALALDPDYARAWALIALCMTDIRFNADTSTERGLEAADQALKLAPDLAEANSAKARILVAFGRYEEAWPYHKRALELDPQSYEVNVGAARWAIFKHSLEQALVYLEAAASADSSDFWSLGMMLQVYRELGDEGRQMATARECLSRIEKALEAEPDNSNALAFGISALNKLGETDRARDWAELVLILDPDNLNALYNTACAMAVVGQNELALEILESVGRIVGREAHTWMTEDKDLEGLRDEPRFIAMMETAAQRLDALERQV